MAIAASSQDRADLPAGSLAARLDRLFSVVRPPHKPEFSYEDVASAVREAGGPTISATYVWQLRTGVRDNPTVRHLEALASFFDVSPAYFLDDDVAARIDAELELLAALRRAGVRRLALRASDLSSASVESITSMVERVRQLEGLGDADDEQASEHG